jgi:hypothetical protein
MSRTATTVSLGFSTVESGRVYAPQSIARIISNLEPTADQSLRSIRGPCLVEPKADQITFGEMFGIYHASLDNGMSDMLIVRDGELLRQHTGWNRTWATIKTGLNSETRQKFPDQWATINNRIIWTNGISHPYVITSDSYVYPLGFDRAPTSPTALGPTSPDNQIYDDYPPNYLGYSQHGHIGTVGDAFAGEAGNLQSGTWYYYYQYESIDGNLSPLSAASNSVDLKTQAVRFNLPNKDTGNRLEDVDDLTRSFAVKGIFSADDWVAAVRVYRTQDTIHRDSTPRLLDRVPAHNEMWLSDNLPDALLTQRTPAENYIATPQFKLMCPYQGGLCVANTSANPGRIHLSEPGFPGTFISSRFIDPDPSGSEIYGVATYQGKLLAWTDHSMYEIVEDAEGLRSNPISATVGCVAPGSIQTQVDGVLIWMSNRGFHTFDGSSVKDITSPIWFRYERLTKPRLGRCSSYIDPRTGEYVLAVPYDGAQKNNLHLIYDCEAEGWREQDWNIYFSQFAVSRDHRRNIFAVGEDPVGSGAGGVLSSAFVLHAENTLYSPSNKTFRWESSELRLDPTGMQRFKLASIYVGFVESSPNTCLLTIYKDGRVDKTITQVVTLHDVDAEASWFYGTAVLGSDRLRTPKLFWRKIDVNCDDLQSFRFAVTVTEPDTLHLKSFRFDATLLDKHGSRVSGPT